VIDRSEEKFQGTNFVHFSDKFVNYVTLPIIPPKGGFEHVVGSISKSLSEVLG